MEHLVNRPDFLSARQAVDRIGDGASVAIVGSGGGVMEPDVLLAAIEARFLETGHPRDLTIVHALGIGDARARGLTHLAHEGLVAKVIGGHWSWSPAMQRLAAEEKISAYALPAGVIGQLLRESGARRPGLITRVGLGSFVDPRLDGGRVNQRATDPVVELIQLDGEDYLRYLPLHIDVALIRGSASDARGNVTCAEEPAILDAESVALAARGNGGIVIAQVGRIVPTGSLEPWLVHLPHTVISSIVEAPEQWQTYAGSFNSDFVTSTQVQAEASTGTSTLVDVRTIIARRAALEARRGTLINVGFGMSAMVVDALAHEGILDDFTLVIEQGAVGGHPASGDLFGVSRFPEAILSSTRQFDFFATGSIDTCFLGMAEVDSRGNVNVSHIGKTTVGPGGFIDIVHGSKRAVFCGPFTAKGLEVAVTASGLSIVNEGAIPKFVDSVGHVTFSAQQALAEGRSALYITERAVFELTPDGLVLRELAPGIDLERDVLQHMRFRPIVHDPELMPASCFEPLRAPVSP